MSALRYALRELAFRRSRSVIAVLSFAVAVLAAVLLTALAASYARAVRAPIETVGADVIVQITGDIPPKLEGLVFPHPNALVPAADVAAIRAMDGVISMTRAVYMWELAPDHYQSVLGIDDSEAGLGALPARLIDGKMLVPGERAVLLDSDFAAKNALKVGADIAVGGTTFPVRGIVDAARGGKVVRADVYMALAPAQALADGGADGAGALSVRPRRRQSAAGQGRPPAARKPWSARSSRCSARRASCRANCRSARR